MIALRRFSTCHPDFNNLLAKLTSFSAKQDSQVEDTVRSILTDVRNRGDQAVLEQTQKYDGLELGSTEEAEIKEPELRQAVDSLTTSQRHSLDVAVNRIRKFHEKQSSDSWSYTDMYGSILGQRVTPLDSVGVYVPGGKAAYPSTVLMNVIPAVVAGVSEIIMVTPLFNGVKNQLLLAAAWLAGVRRVFTIGGAQAIGALAYGTKSIPKVDKIVGPGNSFVAEAKRQVYGTVGIDMIAGPSEVLIICDGETDPDWIAMDLFAQAEHDEMAQAILLSNDADYLDTVVQRMEDLLPDMERGHIIKKALENRGAFIEVRSLDEACKVANVIAPEHLELSTRNPEMLLKKIRNAGAIFLGHNSSEALGDYCAGPNHVLPTAGTAKFASPLGVYDFQKRSSVIQISSEGAQQLSSVAAELATGEGLFAHARSARYRDKK